MTDLHALAALATLLRRRARGEPLCPSTPTERRYADVLALLGDGSEEVPDVLGMLRGVEPRPYLLLNGLLHAARWQEEGARQMCRMLAAGLTTFGELFAGGGDRELQRRYFAFLFAWGPAHGMGLEALLATMKGDAVDPQTAFAVREIMEEGPAAFATSPLFDEEERNLWAAVFAGEEGAAERAQLWYAALCRLPLEVDDRSPSDSSEDG